MARSKSSTSLTVAAAKLETTVNHETARRCAIEAVYTAEGLATAALTGAVIATAKHGPTSKEEVTECWPTCNNPGVYASKFNQGAKVAALIGIDATVALIEHADKLEGGRAHERVAAALSSVIREAKEAGKAKEGLTGKAATKAATNAKAAAKAAAAPRVVAPVKRGAAGSTQIDDAQLRKAAQESGQSWGHLARFVQIAAKAASRMQEPVGREDVARKAVAGLAGLAAFLGDAFPE